MAEVADSSCGHGRAARLTRAATTVPTAKTVTIVESTTGVPCTSQLQLARARSRQAYAC